MAEMPFEGQDRLELVQWLVGQFDAMEEKKPRLVTLEAASGWGKTRVVQEFYRVLAAQRQPDPKYWPSSIIEALPAANEALPAAAQQAAGQGADEESPGQRRKRVYPQRFTPPRGAVPHWFWWGISATAGKYGAAVQSLAVDLRQIEAHREGLESRWRQASGKKERLKQLLQTQRAGSFADAAGQQTLASGLEKLVDASVPGLGLLWWAGKVAWDQRERWSSGAAEPVTIDALTGASTDLVDGLASSLGHFTAAGIPFVIVVEDAHEADASLVDLLVQTVSQQRGPILIVATAWPGLLDDNKTAAHRLVTETPAAARTRLEPAQLGELAPDERVALAQWLLPDVDEQAQRTLAERYRNPYALESACQLPRVRELIEDGQLTPQEINGLPADIKGIYEDMWKSLDDALKDQLMLAVLAAPASVGKLFDERTWDVDNTCDILRNPPWLDQSAGTFDCLLTRSPGTSAWVRHTDQYLQLFHEPVQHQIAFTEAQARYDHRRKCYWKALAKGIDLSQPGLPPARRRALALLLTSLAVEGVIDWTDMVVAGADLLIEEAAASHDVDSLHTVIRLAEAIPTTAPTSTTGRPTQRRIQRRIWYAEALRQTGQIGLAIQQYQDLLTDMQRVLGAEHPGTLATRGNLALALADAGQVDEAIADYQALLADRQRVLGAEHPGTLTTRGNLASALKQAGQVDEAIADYQALLADRQRVLGAEHPGTLTTRGNLAAALADAGQVDEAIADYQALLADRQRVLGAEHPGTLTTRNNLAAALYQAGQVDEAIAQFKTLLTDQQRVLGAEHPHILTTRNNLAAALVEAGQVDEAIADYQALLTDRQRVLGAEHPDTLTTRNNLAAALYQAGRVDEAIAQFKTLLTDQQRVLGAEHPDTLTTLNVLAHVL